jgi:transcriptional regulator with XRE-family HTH domain
MGFRENLKAQLIFSDIRVKELAALSGVKKQTLDSYLRENGYVPSVDAAVRIARALGVSVEYLVTGSETRREKSPSLSPSLRSLLQTIEQLTENDRKIVIKNALNLAAALKERQSPT